VGEDQVVAVLWLWADEGEEGLTVMDREGGGVGTALPRAKGRVVLLGPGLTFSFPPPSSLPSLPEGQEQEQEQEQGQGQEHGLDIPFEVTTALALVVTLQKA